MSFVEKIINKSNYKYSEIYKLLSFPEQWRLINRGTNVENFQHESGWYFYTGCDIVNFRKGFNIKCSSTTMLYLWTIISFRERRFVKSWLKLRENEK